MHDHIVHSAGTPVLPTGLSWLWRTHAASRDVRRCETNSIDEKVRHGRGVRDIVWHVCDSTVCVMGRQVVFFELAKIMFIELDLAFSALIYVSRATKY